MRINTHISKSFTLVVCLITVFLALSMADSYKGVGSKPDIQFIADTAPECLNLAEVVSGIKYPDSAKIKGIEGKVLVKVLISEDGNVIKGTIISGPEVFYDEVRKAAVKLKFSPGTHDGNPVESWLTIPFNFKLAGDKKNWD